MTSTKHMTAEELLTMPDDGQRHELVKGRLVSMSPAGNEHSTVGSIVAHYLWTYVLEHDLGIVTGADGGFIIERDPDTVYAPDAAFVRAERLPPKDERRGYLELVPDLVVEVFSPSDRAREVAIKVRRYLEAGAQLVWVVFPATRTVEVHRPDGSRTTVGADDELDGEDVLPGFLLPIAKLFR